METEGDCRQEGEDCQVTNSCFVFSLSGLGARACGERLLDSGHIPGLRISQQILCRHRLPGTHLGSALLVPWRLFGVGADKAFKESAVQKSGS